MEAGLRRPDRKTAPEEPTAQERAEHMLSEEEVRRNRVVKVREIQSIPRCIWTACS